MLAASGTVRNGYLVAAINKQKRDLRERSPSHCIVVMA
jgi:hypothetical protein